MTTLSRDPGRLEPLSLGVKVAHIEDQSGLFAGTVRAVNLYDLPGQPAWVSYSVDWGRGGELDDDGSFFEYDRVDLVCAEDTA